MQLVFPVRLLWCLTHFSHLCLKFCCAWLCPWWQKTSQSYDLPPSHLEITFPGFHSQGQGVWTSSLTHVIYHHHHSPIPKHTTNLTKRKRLSYLCHLLFWSGSGNIQDRHIALILKYRGISRHTEGCGGIIQIRRLWHKSYNLTSI